MATVTRPSTGSGRAEEEEQPQTKTVFLGLGSNLGDRQANLRRGLDLLAAHLELREVSSLYETEPVGYEAQPRFLNAVCRASTVATPERVLSWAKEAEKALGRTSTFRYGPRSLDVDLLLYGCLVQETPGLVIPHPRLAARAFVLTPLAEIAPAQQHPALHRSVRELLEAVQGREDVRLVEGKGWWR